MRIMNIEGEEEDLEENRMDTSKKKLNKNIMLVEDHCNCSPQNGVDDPSLESDIADLRIKQSKDYNTP